MLNLVATNLGPPDHQTTTTRRGRGTREISGVGGETGGGGAAPGGADQRRVGDLVQTIAREWICPSQEKKRPGTDIKVTTRSGAHGFIDSTHETYRAQKPQGLEYLASSILTIGVAAQQNAVLSWQSDLPPNAVNKRYPGLLDSAAIGVVKLAGANSGTSSGVEEEKGI